MDIRRRSRTIVMPRSRAEFARQVEEHLGRMVMSRTQVEGEPIRRERELLLDPEAQQSITNTYRTLARLHDRSVQISFVLAYDENGKADWVRIYPPENPSPAEVVPPEFLHHNPRLGQLSRRRNEVSRSVASVTANIVRVQEVLDHWGEPLHRSIENPLLRVLVAAAEANRGAHQGFTQGPRERVAAMQADREAQEGVREYLGELEWRRSTIVNELNRIDREIATIEEEQRLMSRTSRRTPGPVGMGTH